MKPGDVIELSVERMSYGAAAVGRYSVGGPEDRPVVVFVDGAAPGERIEARITKQKKNYWEASLVRILTPSGERVTPPCPDFGVCGGCQWQHLSYAAQLRAKADVLLHQVQRATHLPREKLESLLVTHGAVNPFRYRARVQARGNGKGIGYFKAGSREIVHTEDCLIIRPEIRRAWDNFQATKPLTELSRKEGMFKVEWTLTETGQVREAINQEHAALGFTQINPEQNEVLRTVVEKAVLEGTGGRDLLLDLYAGDGNLSRKLSPRFERTVCVETHGLGRTAERLFQHLEITDVSQLPGGVTHVSEDVGDFLRSPRFKTLKPNAIIADPPREGLAGTAALIAQRHVPTVVLVSCDPSTLARDLAAFIDTYEIQRLHLVDMFPQTYHLEIAAVLHRL